MFVHLIYEVEITNSCFELVFGYIIIIVYVVCWKVILILMFYVICYRCYVGRNVHLDREVHYHK